MIKRLYAGLLMGAAVVLMTAAGALAERPGAREWTKRGNQGLAEARDLPLFFRSAPGTSWIRVHNPGSSPCSPVDTADSPDGQTIEHLWCFEGPGGDPNWENNPSGRPWQHWSKFAPPITPASKWHMTRMNPNASNWNAWAGCDSIVGVAGFSNNDAACDDLAFWIRQKGYGDDWNYALELQANGVDDNQAGANSTIKFDVRYDTECNYDYLYVEYSTNTGTTWSFLRDSYPSGDPAVFNAVSGITCGVGAPPNRCCGTDYFGYSDQFNPGGGNENWNGENHSQWIANVQFVIPESPVGVGIRVRWRVFSDGAWSDQDGAGDTDGHSAIDNILLVVDDDGTPDGTAAETFETNNGVPLNNRAIASNTLGTAVTFVAPGLIGETYDGWHLEFDPKYTNKGNTCDFSDDWMWAAKPAGGAIPANGFSFFLVSPRVNCNNWSGGVVQYAEYLCMAQSTEDYANQHVRLYDAANGWSPWNDFDGFITFAGCEFWNMNTDEDITPFLGTTIDSLQVGWEMLDINKAGDFEWGKHGAVQYLIDNVSIGSFDGQGTVFTARVIDIFADTYSRSDPAHTPFLQNAEQGIWSGLTAAPPGTRDFANADSLTVQIQDFNGVTASNVDLWWRHDNGGVSFGPFNKIDMSFAIPDPLSTTDEGTYRAIIGRDDGSVNDAFPPANNRLIWKAATTVQYYSKVTDNTANVQVWPNTADDAPPIYFEFSVLPFGKLTPSNQRVLLVDDVGGRTAVDFENSDEFNAVGGAGFGDFDDPAFEVPENLIEGALILLFGGSETAPNWDKYDVQGAGSSVQCEPRGTSNTGRGLGGFMSDLGAPLYDVLIWTQLDLDAYSFADTTRLELKTYLDRNGNLFATGNEIAFHYGSGGNNADSTIGFLGDYFGTSLTVATDDATLDRVLNTTGRAGTSLAGVELGVYGECPRRWSFDKLTLSAPAIGSQNSILADYTDSSQPADNGRPSVIKNIRRGVDGTFGTADDGVAVLTGFDVSALLSDASRACLMGRVLSQDMGITILPGNLPGCIRNGVDAPVVNARYGFQLANAVPNPFTKTTAIQFSLASKEHVTIEVFNILGQKVRTLVDENMEANSYSRDWDGRSDAGERVSNGIYFYKMIAGDFSETKKTVLLK